MATMEGGTVNKNPYPVIDYREILKRKAAEEKMVQALVEPSTYNQPETKHFSFNNFWRTSDRKTKAEMIIASLALSVTVILLAVMVAQLGNSQPSTTLEAPAAEENWQNLVPSK